jgi:hypothetical protein
VTDPVRVGELLPGVLAEVVDRAGHGYARWTEQVAATGYCAHPVRLPGRVEHADAETGEVRTVYSTEREPDAGRHLAQGVRQPAGVGVSLVLSDLPGRQLPAAGRRAAGRQGCSRDGGRPSAAVRDLHRAIVRPGPLP